MNSAVKDSFDSQGWRHNKYFLQHWSDQQNAYVQWKLLKINIFFNLEAKSNSSRSEQRFGRKASHVGS